jgi:transposase InsO family protein
MSERVKFIARLEAEERVADVARDFGISTKTAYKFWNRWKQHGIEGLHDRSHARLTMRHRTPEAVVALVVAMRKQRPSWGAKKLKVRLEMEHPGVRFPSHGVIHQQLVRNGLVARQKRRRRTPPSYSAVTRPTEPNQVWAIDFKGQFRLGDGRYCYPLTITDIATRFILCCEAFDRIDGDEVWAAVERTFMQYGLPTAIRSDNGPPFACRGLAGLTRLSVKWLRLGIHHQRIEPGKPQQNGQHERMHRTLKQETTRPASSNLLQQQERFDSFVDAFNRIRPHEALDMKCPAALYRPSQRPYEGLPRPHYPLADDVRVVKHNRQVRVLNRHYCQVSTALVGEEVGIREVENGRWLVSFAGIDLLHYDEYDASVCWIEARSDFSPISQ